MKVLFISHSREVGGAELYLLNVLRHLARSPSWQVRLVCRTDKAVDSLAAEASEICEVERLDVVRPQDMMRLRRLVLDSDAVHLNLAFPSGKYQLAAALVIELARRPLVVTHHLSLSVSARWLVFMRRLGRVAARHIAITDVQRNFLIDTFGYPPERVVIVHNGIDTSLFRPPAPGEVAPHGPTCINVARLSPQKGHNVLLDAMAIVVKQVPGARLVVIGDGELRGALRERVRDLGLDDHVELTGSLPREQVASRLRGADLFILPSRYEGSPLALMEAMASGLACVATDVSGVRELITGGATGRIVPVGIPAAMAAAIVELLSNHWVRSAIGVASRQVVVAGFNLERSMSETEAVLSEIVGG